MGRPWHRIALVLGMLLFDCVDRTDVSIQGGTLTVAPASVIADGVSSATVTLALGAVPLADNTNVIFSSSSANAIFTQPTGLNANNATVGTVRSAVPETQTIYATLANAYGSLQLPVSATIDFLPEPNATTVNAATLVAYPTSLVADGTSTTTLMFTARNDKGAPLAGQTVTWRASGAHNTFSTTTGVTDANGTHVITLTSTLAQTQTITAGAGSISASAQVTFTAGSPNTTYTVLNASPRSVTADNSSITLLTLALKDAQQNPIAGQAATFSSSGSNNTIAPASGITTDANGKATATLKSTRAEVKMVTVHADGIAANADVTFLAGPLSPNSTLVASPASNVANNSSAITFIVTAQDIYANSLSGIAVSFSSSGLNNSLGSTNTLTDANGLASTTLVTETAEVKTMTATLNGNVVLLRPRIFRDTSLG